MQIQNNAKGVKPGIKMLTQMDNVEASESQNVATCKPYHLNCLTGSKEKKNVLLVINSYFFFQSRDCNVLTFPKNESVCIMSHLIGT